MRRARSRDALPLGLSERRLRYFSAVVEAGSIRGAADKLDIEASVVSRQLHQLEDELGVKLVDRRGRGIAPTEAALLVMDHYRLRRSEEETLLAQLGELNGLQRGRIHIVAGEGFIGELIEAVLHDYCIKYPRIVVTLELMPVTEVLRRVLEDRADVGLAYAPPADPGIHRFAMKRQPMCVITRPGHPLASRNGKIELRDLTTFPFALMGPDFGLGQLTNLAEIAEKTPLTRAMMTNSISAMKHYVRAGLGLTLLPRLVVAEEIDTGQLVALRTRNPIFETADAQLVLRDKRTRSAAFDALLARLKKMSWFE
jgi:DNA-binding transcriptional LysR family regulator